MIVILLEDFYRLSLQSSNFEDIYLLNFLSRVFLLNFVITQWIEIGRIFAAILTSLCNIGFRCIVLLS